MIWASPRQNKSLTSMDTLAGSEDLHIFIPPQAHLYLSTKWISFKDFIYDLFFYLLTMPLA
jgi:hypothetical protein